MSRGFLKDVGGVKRLRMVKTGYDANDLTLPYNLVVFDSVFPPNLTPWAAGVVRVSTAGTLMKIVSWADPGYVPMTILTAAQTNGARLSVFPWTSNNPVARAARDGIYLTTGSIALPADFYYIAFRVAG
ncbi:hypothetical protein GJU93_02540 [Brucella sp. 10RB9212]|uniref:hypothetical protein n=1 Tax=unclassified Brucella TaxID=2632610 RepID=UPI0012AE527D|nr:MULTISPECIES: hypothetical protein [unclassified Brucella]MRN45482.1 hypothetical protein [Brucella sp. 10RB9212]